MSTLLMGGSFDPIHTGHLICAQCAREVGGFDRVVFIPCGTAVLKKNSASFQHRAEMTRLAVSFIPNVEYSFWEGTQSGPSYSINTFTELQKQIEDECWWLIGSDNLYTLPQWHNFAAVQETMRFAIMRRTDFVRNMSQMSHYLGITAVALETPIINISSTMVRNRVSSCLPIRGFVPLEVEKYIYLHNLYK